MCPDLMTQKFNLGPDSTLILNNLTDPTEALQAAGLQTFPMVSSFPYPPQFLDWMRQVFKDPQPFINAAVKQVQRNKFSGFNM